MVFRWKRPNPFTHTRQDESILEEIHSDRNGDLFLYDVPSDEMDRRAKHDQEELGGGTLEPAERKREQRNVTERLCPD